MSRLKAFIVDDEGLAVDRLKRLLERTHRVDIAGTATDPEDAIAALQAAPVDVLFLDIQMPGLTGFQLLERIDRDVRVIFTTAFDKLERLSAQPAPDVRRLARELAAQLTPSRRLDRIASRVGERTTLLDVA